MWKGNFLVVVCLGLFFANAGVEAKNDPAKLPADPAMQFYQVRFSLGACEPNCPEWIAAEGRIAFGTAKQFASFIAANPLRKRLPILLSSGGGSIEDALAMGRMIRRNGVATAVGKSILFGCTNDDREAGKCKPDKVLGALDGAADAARAYCASACPLMLLGGQVRVVEPQSFVGLHEPVAKSQPYVDHYLEKYRMVQGRKQIISRKFVKRTYLAEKTVAGVTPHIRDLIGPYLAEMGGSPAILDEMQKAAPKDMNWIGYSGGERERLGLVTINSGRLSQIAGLQLCKAAAYGAQNCVYLKAKAPPVIRPFER